eukprot:CAMPEP_0118920250 /NCGR_PEP_ID=MMETSP1166-20130328/18971_1 /TAXON_ID=1104430 /ORGANISM="Chrysoreinhardia sp, Strain CCMP3193" /LENGTH=73 /DNA_ID=CAMNT_0006860787 /DNA_START=1001 /DNA_END=1218 /DNA_ORIENTATION=-
MAPPAEGLSLYAALANALRLQVSPQRLRIEVYDNMIGGDRGGAFDAAVLRWDRRGGSARAFALAQRRSARGGG